MMTEIESKTKDSAIYIALSIAFPYIAVTLIMQYYANFSLFSFLQLFSVIIGAAAGILISFKINPEEIKAWFHLDLKQ